MLMKLLKSGTKELWLYHCAGVGFLIVTLTSIFYLLGPEEVFEFNLVASIVWCLGFTISVLWLRQRYKSLGWSELPFWRLVKNAIPTIAIGGLFTTAMMILLSVPFYWDVLLDFNLEKDPDCSPSEILISLLLRNWFNTCFHISVWFGAYLAITWSRRGMAAEIDNLTLLSTLKETQLASLSNQLNPHFLFNALNNIRFMIGEDAKDAEAMLLSLSDVLRYSLESSGKQKVSLDQELGMVEKYIALVKTQFEDKLEYSQQLALGSSDYTVPPMMIQMLLENAVKHGVERLPGGGAVKLNVSTDNEGVRIEVLNDAPNPQASSALGMGIGLQNIQKRLELIYGPRSELKTGVERGQFYVSVSLPINAEGA